MGKIRLIGAAVAGIATAASWWGSASANTTCTVPTPAQVVNQSIVVNVPSDFDSTAKPTPTTTVYFTLLLPQRCPSDRFPLVLHSHGYGGSRLTALAADGTLKPADPMFKSIDELAQALPYHGYAVLSFDERGHGESVPKNGGGYARIIDPQAETQDARALLDWAYEHAALYNLQTESGKLDQAGHVIPNDLAVATLGYSYGGGFQLPLAALDNRIDAIIPTATWHDLLYSVLPGDAVKLGFDGLLCLEAITGSVSNTPLMQTMCNKVGVQSPTAFNIRSLANLVRAVSGLLALPRPVSETELISFFSKHGMNYFEAQEKAGLPWGFGETRAKLRPVPALFLQGNRDNLFNLTEAYWNLRYFSSAFINAGLNVDVSLLTTEGGHMNPLANQSEGTANCGKVIGVNSILAWLDFHLKSVPFTNAIPKVCISVADTVGAPVVTPVGLELDHFPVGSQSGTGGVPAVLPSLRATLTILTENPVFVPVTTIHGAGQVLAGVPTIKSLTVTDGPLAIQATDAFVGVGILRGGKTILVDDQVTAFGQGTHTANRNVNEDNFILMPAVGEQLQDGDEVGLLFYPQHIQYASIVSAEGISGVTGIVSQIWNVPIPPVTSSLEPELGLLYLNPYSVTASDIELPILIPGTYPNSQLSQ